MVIDTGFTSPASAAPDTSSVCGAENRIARWRLQYKRAEHTRASADGGRAGAGIAPHVRLFVVVIVRVCFPYHVAATCTMTFIP